MAQKQDLIRILTPFQRKHEGKETELKVITRDLQKLSEEFDTLGVPAIEIAGAELTTVVEQLIQSSYVLIQMYRKKLKEINHFQLGQTKQETVQLKFNEYMDNTESEISARDGEIKKLKCELFKMKCDWEEKENLNKNLKVQLTQTKAAYKAKINEQEHTVHQLHNEIEILKQKCGESFGKNKNSDSFLTDYLLKYKNREEVYKETIAKLQDNNRMLMEEVLDLKQDIVSYMCSDSKSETKCKLK